MAFGGFNQINGRRRGTREELSKHQIQPEYGERLTQHGTAKLVSRDQILRRAGGQGNVHFPCLAVHEQDWQPYQTLSIECPSSIFSWPVYFVIPVPFSLSLFFVCVFLLLSLELGRCSSDLFLSSRPRTGLATTYITGYG